jgi:hypothetical protein
LPEYIFDPIVTDATVLEDDAVAWIQSRWPDWIPSESHLETWVIVAMARMVAEARDVASDVPPEIFKYLGSTILGVIPSPAGYATVGSTWTLVDNPAGRTIEAGTLVSLDGPDGVPVAFEVVSDVNIAVGVLSTTAGEVQLRATTAGGDTQNNIGGVGTVADMIDNLAWVDAVTLTGATTGGTDEEDIDAYLDRLSSRLTLLTPRPILPRDHELLAVDLARQAGAEVRALALDTYNPADNTYNNERMVAVALSDANTGLAVAAPIKTAVDSGLQALREVNFVVNVIDPNYTTVDVTFQIVVRPGYIESDTLQEAIDAVTDALRPYNAGKGDGTSGINDWEQVDAIRRQDISTVINNVQSVAHWTTLTIGLNGGAQTNAETFALAGAAPLPQPGAIVGTIAP